MPVPRPDDDHYDEWLDTQIAIGDHISLMDASWVGTGVLRCDEAISQSIAAELAQAIRLALQWLDTPTVVRAVADEIEAFDRRQADDDEPF